MGIFSVNKRAKSRALEYEFLANTLQGQQRDIDFGRTLLSNIRQERIARAQLRASAYSDDTVSSSAAGAVANIDSALAGEMGYSYETSERMEKIQKYQQDAAAQWKKYQKSLERSGKAGGMMGTLGAVAGSIVGTIVAPGVGTVAGAAIGGAAGTAATSVLGGGHVATGAATRSAISGTITSGISVASAGLQASEMAAKGLTYMGETTAEGIRNAMMSSNLWRLQTAASITKSGWGASGYSQQQLQGVW